MNSAKNPEGWLLGVPLRIATLPDATGVSTWCMSIVEIPGLTSVPPSPYSPRSQLLVVVDKRTMNATVDNWIISIVSGDTYSFIYSLSLHAY